MDNETAKRIAVAADACLPSAPAAEVPTPRSDAACRVFHGLHDLFDFNSIQENIYGVSLKDARTLEKENVALRTVARELAEAGSEILECFYMAGEPNLGEAIDKIRPIIAKFNALTK